MTAPTEARTPAVPGLVSVIIGAYNSAGYVAETIESVLAQTYQPLELIVVDDGSTDATPQVLASFGDRIRVVRQANGGIANARNTGLRHARGEFIALMDHDDLCMPERIALQVGFMRSHPGIGLCCSEFSAFDENGPLATSYGQHYYSQCTPARGGVAARYPRAERLDVTAWLPTPSAAPVAIDVYLGAVRDELICGNFVHPPTVLFRAELVDRVGLFDTQAVVMCDWDWLVRAAALTEFAYLDRPLLNYRRSATQQSSERFLPRASLDAFRVAERLCAREPALRQRLGARLRRHLGSAALDAAYGNSEARPALALKLVATAALRYGVVNDSTVRTLIRALVPKALLDWVRQRRGAPAATS